MIYQLKINQEGREEKPNPRDKNSTGLPPLSTFYMKRKLQNKCKISYYFTEILRMKSYV